MHLYVFSIFSCMILPFEHVGLNVLYMNNYYMNKDCYCNAFVYEITNVLV